MSCRLLATIVLGALLGAGARGQTAGLVGRMDGEIYVSPTGEFRFPSPVLPELGGTVSDTGNVVTFSDNFNVHISIACFPQDATQKWELETRARRDYLLYFFTTFVLADFQARFPGARIESARYLPGLLDGALIAYALLPGGSAFEAKNRILGTPDQDPVTAKRGNLLFVRQGHVYVVSTELAERATERSTYALTREKEDAILSDRLTSLAGRFVFTTPKARSP
jgi:hypothetical protein